MNSPAKTILIVDDEFSIAETLGEILAWEGYAVNMAPNGRVALNELEKGIPSLMLIDYMMPVMDGLQVLEVVRSSPKLEHLPVILMTAARLDLPPERRDYDALLRKPFEIDTVLQLVSSLVHGRPRARR